MRRESLLTIFRNTVGFATPVDKERFTLQLTVCAFVRMPGGPRHPHDHSGGVPFRCVHWPHPAGCVEGAGFSPRQEGGGQV